VEGTSQVLKSLNNRIRGKRERVRRTPLTLMHSMTLTSTRKGKIRTTRNIFKTHMKKLIPSCLTRHGSKMKVLIMKGRQRSQPGIITATVTTGTRFAQTTAVCHLSHRLIYTQSLRSLMGRRLTQWLEIVTIGLEKSIKTFQVKR
jgi:hypothetical protein